MVEKKKKMYDVKLMFCEVIKMVKKKKKKTARLVDNELGRTQETWLSEQFYKCT